MTILYLPYDGEVTVVDKNESVQHKIMTKYNKTQAGLISFNIECKRSLD